VLVPSQHGLRLDDPVFNAGRDILGFEAGIAAGIPAAIRRLSWPDVRGR